MFADCYIVFRRVTRRVRSGDGYRVAADYEPACVCAEYGDAARFRDAITEATGEPALIGRSKLWARGGAHGES